MLFHELNIWIHIGFLDKLCSIPNWFVACWFAIVEYFVCIYVDVVLIMGFWLWSWSFFTIFSWWFGSSLFLILGRSRKRSNLLRRRRIILYLDAGGRCSVSTNSTRLSLSCDCIFLNCLLHVRRYNFRLRRGWLVITALFLSPWTWLTFILIIRWATLCTLRWATICTFCTLRLLIRRWTLTRRWRLLRWFLWRSWFCLCWFHTWCLCFGRRLSCVLLRHARLVEYAEAKTTEKY